MTTLWKRKFLAESQWSCCEATWKLLQNLLLKDKSECGYRFGHSNSSFLLPVQYWFCCSVSLFWSLRRSIGASLGAVSPGAGYMDAYDSASLMSRAQKAVWTQPKKYPACACSWLWKGALKPHQGVQQSAWCRGEGKYSSQILDELKAIVLKNVTSRGRNIILKNFIQWLWFQEASVEKMKWILKITIKHI